jgi:hypothetical protein
VRVAAVSAPAPRPPTRSAPVQPQAGRRRRREVLDDGSDSEDEGAARATQGWRQAQGRREAVAGGDLSDFIVPDDSAEDSDQGGDFVAAPKPAGRREPRRLERLAAEPGRAVGRRRNHRKAQEGREGNAIVEEEEEEELWDSSTGSKEGDSIETEAAGPPQRQRRVAATGQRGRRSALLADAFDEEESNAREGYVEEVGYREDDSDDNRPLIQRLASRRTGAGGPHKRRTPRARSARRDVRGVVSPSFQPPQPSRPLPSSSDRLRVQALSASWEALRKGEASFGQVAGQNRHNRQRQHQQQYQMHGRHQASQHAPQADVVDLTDSPAGGAEAAAWAAREASLLRQGPAADARWRSRGQKGGEDNINCTPVDVATAPLAVRLRRELDACGPAVPAPAAGATPGPSSGGRRPRTLGDLHFASSVARSTPGSASPADQQRVNGARAAFRPPWASAAARQMGSAAGGGGGAPSCNPFVRFALPAGRGGGAGSGPPRPPVPAPVFPVENSPLPLRERLASLAGPGHRRPASPPWRPRPGH